MNIIFVIKSIFSYIPSNNFFCFLVNVIYYISTVKVTDYILLLLLLYLYSIYIVYRSGLFCRLSIEKKILRWPVFEIDFEKSVSVQFPLNFFKVNYSPSTEVLEILAEMSRNFDQNPTEDKM